MKLGIKTIVSVLVAALAPGLAIAQGTCKTNPKMATDWTHSAILSRDCTVWMWGFNNAGQFAREPDSYTEPEKFQKLQGIPPLLDIVVASDHTLGISQGHHALIWGSEEYLSCAGIFFPFNITPKRVPGLPKVKSIAARKHINVYVTQDGLVFEQGCTDMTAGTIKGLPAQVTGLPKVVSIAVGNNHRLALTKDGEVWSWGDWNHYGQLGTGDTEPRTKPVKVEGLPKIVSIAAGVWHSMAVDAYGNIWVWGSSDNW